MQRHIPKHLIDCVSRHPGPSLVDITANMRPESECMTPDSMGAQKSTRLSFVQLLARKMIEGRWRLEKDLVSFDESGRGRIIYQLDLAGYRMTYIARSSPPISAEDAIANENLGRRVGTNRHIWGTLFLGQVGAERIAEEFRSIETRDMESLRARSDIIGWTPGSRSARIFDEVVDALSSGHQPSLATVRKSGYLIRNGGYIAAGRYGTLSYEGLPDDHPLKPPYIADLFGILMLREVGLDLVNGMAAARSAQAATLSDILASYFGVGNASGLGMCVTLQRWTHWVSTWMLVREFCLARARLMRISDDPSKQKRFHELLNRAISYYETLTPDSEEFVVPHAQIASNLRRIKSSMESSSKPFEGTFWGDIADSAKASFDGETAELINALLIELFPEFADDVAEYIPEGMVFRRDYSPEFTVQQFRRDFLSHYKCELLQDLGNSDVRRHFWYHSEDNGEQRRGERVVDPHENYESFIDHLGAIQRLAATLTAYDDETPMAIVVADHPDLAFVVSRVETMAHESYREIQGSLLHKDFTPAKLIRWYLTVIGLDSTYPLSSRWVPGVLFQGLPLWSEIAAGSNRDWRLASTARFS
ncbi:hypothetical protein FHS85_002463 [Rhodoligotrophos appendicifer]|uniref:hypothetical protein n=1 Tax=Rhodoligotrophos appendicifer TaxID=987056 RepID=UPI001185F873|nr:hypothetical protein [Rhodoligotrophos appendicifer]